MLELPPMIAPETPKRERKTRQKPVIAPTESPEVSSVKKAMFGRLARKAVLEKQKRGAPEHVEDVSKNTRAIEDARTAMQSVNQQIDELTSTILDMAEGRSLKDVEESVASGTEENGMLAAMISMRDTLNIEREEAGKTLASLETQAAKQPRMKKMSAKEHASALSNIEWEMNERIGEEERFEALLGGMQGPYDGQWEKSAFEKFVPYLEETYLVPGAVTNLVLKQYVENETSLSPTLLGSVKSAVDALVRRHVAHTRSGIVGVSLRGRLEQSVYEKENTPDVRKALVDAYLADTSPEKELLRFIGPDAAQIAVREIALREGKANIDELRFVLATFAIEDSNVGNSHLPRFMKDDERRIIVAARGGKSFSGVAPEARPILEKHGVDWNGPSKLMNDAVDILQNAESYLTKLTEAESVVEKVVREDWTIASQKRVDAAVNDRAAGVVADVGRIEGDAQIALSEITRLAGTVTERSAKIHSLAQEQVTDFDANTWNSRLNDMHAAAQGLQKYRTFVRSLESRVHSVVNNDGGAALIAPRVQQICETEHREWKDRLSNVLQNMLPKEDVWNISKVVSKYEIDRRIEHMSEAVMERNEADAKEWWPKTESMMDRASATFREQIAPCKTQIKATIATVLPLPDSILNSLRTETLPEAREYLKNVGEDAEAKVKLCEKEVEDAERAFEFAKKKKVDLEGSFMSVFRTSAIKLADEDIAMAWNKVAEARRAKTHAIDYRSAVYSVESRLQGSMLAE